MPHHHHPSRRLVLIGPRDDRLRTANLPGPHVACLWVCVTWCVWGVQPTVCHGPDLERDVRHHNHLPGRLCVTDAHITVLRDMGVQGFVQ
ncbi:hypothetical protein RRG08_062354 [Elysia crispata]|uniref:Uncharacterized protein n=1 Tax=Elysia crispata TaxID=231223 RepID=A0AAE0YHA7_9GAST|nr:hypothetical protein RRG08_062354 [Elysia crispata]